MSDIVNNIVQDILAKIESANIKEAFDDTWVVQELKDGVAIVTWVKQWWYAEVVVFDNGIKWMILDVAYEYIGVLVLGDFTKIQQWQTVKRTGKMLEIGVGKEYLGRVLNGLWDPIDGGNSIAAKEFSAIEKIAPGVITRKAVTVPLQTGIKAIDAMIPIGRWQRELIIGDRQTGKTSVAIDTILAQKWQGVYCIYVAIWQKESKVARLTQKLREAWALEYTIIINAAINSPSVTQYLAPYVWCTLWEWFMNNAMDALIIYDDLSKHATAYREMSLLLRRPPGREAYPGDVFYLHSRLLERAARVNENYGGGSLTALPIIETQSGDVSAYIPTNVISITDGQIYLESDLFNAGIKPAVNVWLSVSRVWWAAQTGIMKKVSWKLKLELAAYRELESFAKFGSDLDAATLKKLTRWEKLVEMLKQKEWTPISYAYQAILIYAGTNWYLDKIQTSDIWAFEEDIYESLRTTYSSLITQIEADKKLTEKIEERIKEFLTVSVTEFLSVNNEDHA